MNYESAGPMQTSFEADLERLNYSTYLFALEDEDNPILSLDSDSRIAFLLHHLLGYKIEDAALLVELSEKDFRADLRSAYLQLVSREFGPNVNLSEVLEEPAMA